MPRALTPPRSISEYKTADGGGASYNEDFAKKIKSSRDQSTTGRFANHGTYTSGANDYMSRHASEQRALRQIPERGVFRV